MNKFNLTVAYRIYPGIGKPVALFNSNKLKLVEFAFNSFLHSLGNLKIKLFVILDSCPKEYKSLILSKFPNAILIETSKAGNSKTFEMQLELLLSQNETNLVYFAEDDYFYQPNSLETAVDFFYNHDPDFLTLYYHPDYSNLEIHKILKTETIDFKSLSWQRVCSTTLTFLTTKNTLEKTKNIFLTFGQGNYDSSIWLSLTKQGIFHPKLYFLPFASSRKLFFLKMITKMWLHNWQHLIFGKKYSLFAPFPSLATHLEKDSLSPNIKWKELFDHYLQSWNLI